jgi:succinyl-CoA synthetase alpha subunit
VITMTLVRPSAYRDSVTLLGLARELRARPGVLEAAALMATPANKALLAQAGLLDHEGDAAGPNDLVIVIRADSASVGEQAKSRAEAVLDAAGERTERHGAHAPRTIDSACRQLPDATLALVSVPGDFAAAETRKALHRGLHVMLFSDNVSLEDEVALKRLALSRGRLLLGPDCGTAYLHGARLGFANVVPRGRVGLVAASGTGLQHVSTLLAARGEGISHGIGVGGRDMTDAVNGMMTLAALDALGEDPDTEIIVVVGKPPAPAVRRRVEARLRAIGRPAVLALLGRDVARLDDGVLRVVPTLEDAADAVVATLKRRPWLPRPFTAPAAEMRARVEAARRSMAAGQAGVVGLYAGGTLAHEAVLILAALLGPVGGNLTHASRAAHRVLDLGADELTRGRAHPMLDPTTRIAEIERAGMDPEAAVLLLDVVLGHGAAADPAGDVAPALEAAQAEARAQGRWLAVVASVTGTAADPQGLSRQVARLEAAGTWILPSNAEAARVAACIAGGPPVLAAVLERDGAVPRVNRSPDSIEPVHRDDTGAGRELLTREPVVINLGLASFAADLDHQGVHSLHVQWIPPGAGDPRQARIVAELDGGDVARANRAAFERLVGAEPVLVDCQPAAVALGLPDRTVLHAGPPLRWEHACPIVQAAILCAIRYEGWAGDDAAARALIERGTVSIGPCHHGGAAGPMTGIVTPSMPVFVVENRRHGNRACATINEGLGRVLRFGANDASVVERLRWLAAEAGPLLGAVIRAAGGIDLRAMMAQALRMGDEMHQRNVAASSLLARALMPHLARAAGDAAAVARLAEFVAGNDQFFLNLAMAAGKASADPCLGIEGSTMVVTMARNGSEFGIRVAGLGDRWFTAPVERPRGLYFPGFGDDDANPDLGDSAIVETIGLGAFAMAASPAVARFVGAGGMGEALAVTAEMAEICLGDHPHFRLATLDERGSPVGIDVRKVVETGITPLINTGIAGKTPGVGQIGAGVARAPLACFEQALAALAERAGRPA